MEIQFQIQALTATPVSPVGAFLNSHFPESIRTKNRSRALKNNSFFLLPICAVAGGVHGTVAAVVLRDVHRLRVRRDALRRVRAVARGARVRVEAGHRENRGAALRRQLGLDGLLRTRYACETQEARAHAA